MAVLTPAAAVAGADVYGVPRCVLGLCVSQVLLVQRMLHTTRAMLLLPRYQLLIWYAHRVVVASVAVRCMEGPCQPITKDH
jgi:hypothetical protein